MMKIIIHDEHKKNFSLGFTFFSIYVIFKI